MKTEVEPERLDGMELEQLRDYLSDECLRQSESKIREQIEQSLSTEVDRRDWNWQELASWANRVLGMNTNDRELKKLSQPEIEGEDINREALEQFLMEGAQQAIPRTDFSPLETILLPDFPQRQLCGWLNHQFTLQIAPEEITKFEDAPDAMALITSKLHELYRDHEIRFPVSVGLTRFMHEHAGSDRAGLIGWANQRFRARLSSEALQDAPRRQIEEELLKASRDFYPGEDALEKIREQVDLAEARVNGHPNGNPQDYGELVQYGNQTLELGLQAQSLAQLPKMEVRQAVFRAFERKFRPEMGQAERAILLEVLDTAWKEHLYLMDHLRSSIGLEGYAGKDPKVEYKRQGMRAFDSMWDRVREQVTGAIFRVEHESPMFVGSLWQISETTHAEAQSIAEEFQGQAAPNPDAAPSNDFAPGQEIKAVEPIRNFKEKVGRNDLCPCGSGKKYKKCHGAEA
jgi:preprotein translocase subunit SecA